MRFKYNTDLANHVLNHLNNFGIEQIVICPGGRSAPFLEILARCPHHFKTFSFFDERTAGFFALGKSKKLKKPVAIITTSGTAVAELLPAVIEAYYKSVPLLIISADRPPKLRGTGAPQVIEQKNIFGMYVENSFDISISEYPTDFNWKQNIPTHINVCFDEPLLPPDISDGLSFSYKKRNSPPMQKKVQNEVELKVAFANFRKRSQKPLLLLSETFLDFERDDVAELISKISIPTFAEAISQCSSLKCDNLIQGSEKSLLDLYHNGEFDGLIRVGGVPTNKLWRVIEDGELPVINFSEFPFSGVSHAHVIEMDFIESLIYLSKQDIRWRFDNLKKYDEKVFSKTKELLLKYPRSEPSFISRIGSFIKSEEYLYLGNSLPIREWDLVSRNICCKKIFSNRGANGIDGQLATALGMVNSKETLWIILGDLTTLYDLNAFWALRYLPEGTQIKFICINNGGGKIFEDLFNSNIYYNSHDTNFEYIAKFWGLDYFLWTESQQSSFINDKNQFIEVRSNAEQTRAFNRELKKII